MTETFEVESSTSWLSRLVESFKKVLIGIVLFLVSFVVLFWNEGRAVSEVQGLKKGKELTVSVKSDKVDPDYEGKLVHLTGQATTKEIISDPLFGLKDNVLKLQRKVEMYQWKEEKKSKRKKKLGGGTKTVTTYTYREAWSEQLIDSNKFHKKKFYNPSSKFVPSQTKIANVVMVGAFRLSNSLLAGISKYEPVAITGQEQLSPTIKGKFQAQGGKYYYMGNPNDPKIGDIRVSFYVVRPCIVSIVSGQKGNTFYSFPVTEKKSINMIEVGDMTKDAMFQKAIAQAKLMTWILRLVGFIFMVIGISLVFSPLVTFADLIPIFGDILNAGVVIFAIAVSLPLTLITIAFAWLFYRPLLAVGLIVLGVGAFFGIRNMTKKKK